MKIRLGDLIEIKTNKGLAYALYTHYFDKPPRYGALIRIFEGLFLERPSALREVLERPIQFSVFFPLQAAVNRKLVTVAGNLEIPGDLQKFPTFRSAWVDPKTREKTWFLWDGEHSRQVGTLSDQQRKLSIRGIWNDTLLIKRIEQGWRPEFDPARD